MAVLCDITMDGFTPRELRNMAQSANGRQVRQLSYDDIRERNQQFSDGVRLYCIYPVDHYGVQQPFVGRTHPEIIYGYLGTLRFRIR